MTITIDNTQAGAIALSALALNDVFPADVEIAAIPNGANTCGGTLTATAGANNIDLSGGALSAGASCTFQADVTSVAGPPGDAKANNIPAAALNNAEGLDAAADANATLTMAALPSIAKAFAPSTIVVGGISTLTITIDNTQANSIALSALALNDVFPADVVIAATPNGANTCGGTLTATAGANNIDLSGGALSAGGSCTFQADVTAPTAGAKANNIPAAALKTTPRASMPPPTPTTP